MTTHPGSIEAMALELKQKLVGAKKQEPNFDHELRIRELEIEVKRLIDWKKEKDHLNGWI